MHFQYAMKCDRYEIVTSLCCFTSFALDTELTNFDSFWLHRCLDALMLTRMYQFNIEALKRLYSHMAYKNVWIHGCVCV